MARKLGGFQRVLDAPALFSVAYGEIASSIYFALGIVAAYALGFTPLVLLGAGIVFLIVALSYAEGTAAIPETGGAATFVRRAFNDLFGFLTGWALFLDYLIVIALSTLFLPHYLGTALGVDVLRESPWDAVVAVSVIALIAGIRLARRSQLHAGGIAVAGLDLATQLLLVILGLALLFSPDLLTEGNVARERPLVVGSRLRATARNARLHRARDGRQPRRGDPRAWTYPAAQPLLRTRARRRADGADRGRRPLCVPGRERPDRARRRVAQGTTGGDRRGAPGFAARLARRCAAHVRGPHRRARPPGRGDDVDLRLHEAGVLARRASPAAAELRPAQPAHARLTAGDPGRRPGSRSRS